VDVRDVALGTALAEDKGKNGERYILGSDVVKSTTDLVEIARSLYPDVRKPIFKPTRKMLVFLAFISEMGAKLTGVEPPLLRKQVDLYHEKKFSLDISKAKEQLGYDPRPAEEAIKEAFRYLKERT